MGLTNLEDIDSFVAANRRNYRQYREAIERIDGLSLLRYDESESNNYQYIVLDVASDFPLARDDVVRTLHAENVLARKYFWPGCHNMEPYRSHYPNAGLVLPHTQHVADRVVVLPSGSSIGELQVDCILSVLRVLGKERRRNSIATPSTPAEHA
jgi:dTDP-4-amino-4,6-dideoxygalactose transaminase